ncbi:hypothetical protein LZZ85_11330 [Terrimonas sp. NA20]|uniref:Uncharacterized protein n=1 Tax=Terrimonas ginsenosidimutans TaxID=2908004 RepID=A0ABS9KRI5_9BACT|nr:hypothetical protein [Terrimonas ginsenosidimutans]MCG2614880.1 hypothetical protein [Terrimonas ginsenosidimutans]
MLRLMVRLLSGVKTPFIGVGRMKTRQNKKLKHQHFKMSREIVRQDPSLTLAMLSPVDRQAMQRLSLGERKYVELALQEKISVADPLNTVTEFVAAITSAYTRAGYKMPDAATLALYADETREMLLERYPAITVAEFKQAIKCGVYGDAGDFTGLNPKTFLQFVKHYLFTEARKEAVKVFESNQLLISNQRFEMTPEERAEDDKKFVNYLYNDFLNGYLLVDFVPSFVYEFLESQKLLNLTKDQKIAFVDRAKAYSAKMAASSKMKGSKRETFTDQLQKLLPGSAETTLAKQFAVVDFFANAKIEGRKTIFETPKRLNDK